MPKRKYPEGTEAFTVPETARKLGVSDHTIWNLIRNGNMPTFKIGKLIRIPRKEVDRILEGNGNGQHKNTG